MEGLTFLNIKIRYTHRTWFLNTVHQWKELGLLGEMIDPTTGTKEIKDEPGASCCARKWGSTQIRKEKKKKGWWEYHWHDVSSVHHTEDMILVYLIEDTNYLESTWKTTQSAKLENFINDDIIYFIVIK